MTRRTLVICFAILLVQLAAMVVRGADVREVLPLAFEPNVGQTDARARFVARGRGYAVFVTSGEVALTLGGGDALRMSWVGGSPEPRVVASGPLAGRSNYLVGSDESAWRRNVPTYSQVRCEGVYPGVDLVLHGNEEQLEYDFEVAPGVDASQVRLQLDGHDDARIDENGDLVLRMRGGELRQVRPVAYEIDSTGARRQVAARYELRGDGEIGFSLPERAPGSWLVVDPVLVYGAFIGGTGFDEPREVAVDASGAVYVVGITGSMDFPVTSGALDTSFNVVTDGYLAKIDASGTALVYATFLGGTSIDICEAVAVDATGSAYVAGTTGSAGFPTTPGAFDTVLNGANDVFALKLNPAGDGLVYSTLLGGSRFSDEEYVEAIRLAPNGDLLLAGSTPSVDFPTTPGAYDATYDGNHDVFVTRMNATGTGLVFSTYLGTGLGDFGYGVGLDASGAAYVAGYSANFPVTPGGHDLASARGFVAKLAPDGGSLVYSARTALAAFEIAVDDGGAVYAACGSDLEFFSQSDDVEVLKLNPAGSAYEFSKTVGSPERDFANDMALGPNGTVYVVGIPGSSAFPTTPDAYDRTGDSNDGFLFAVSPDGQTLLYSTFLGGDGEDTATGVAVDAAGDVYVIGRTGSSDFMTTGFGTRAGVSSYVAKLRVVTGDTPGVYAPSSGAWFLRNANSSGAADLTFGYGSGGALVPIAGDWDGDGRDTPGLYNVSTGAFFLKNTSAGGGADVVFTFGAGGAGVVPVVGDWNGDGTDTVGLYNSSTGVFFLRNANASGVADVVFSFGAGGAVPITGDWNGDGIDTVGLYDASTGAFFLRNQNAAGVADVVFTFGAGGATPLAGDWNRDGTDTVGLYVAGSGTWFLRNANAAGVADVVFGYGPPGLVPLTGDWDGE